MLELVDYGVTYGECVGYCTSVLRIDGSVIELIQTSQDPSESPRRYRGEIDRALSERIVAVVARLEPERLQRTYGTPDARDEGAVTFRLRGRAGMTAHSCSRGAPPDELSKLDELLSPVLLGWIDGDAPAGVHFHEAP